MQGDAEPVREDGGAASPCTDFYAAAKNPRCTVLYTGENPRNVLRDYLKSTFHFIKRNYETVNKISGGLLILIGILMATGLFGRFLGLLS